VWVLPSPRAAADFRRKYKGVPCISRTGFRGWLRAKYCLHFARAAISSNIVLDKKRDDQFALFLAHGSKVKKTRGRYQVGNNVDYMLCQADFFRDVTAYEYNIDPRRLICLGYPRNDYFLEKRDVLTALLPGKQFEKVILWLPTWRRHMAEKVEDMGDGVGIPLLKNMHEAAVFNDFLRGQNTAVLIKPHPSQHPDVIRFDSLSHLFLISDDMLGEKGIHLYELLSQSDALITDYSSVVYDYLLLGRPIALTVDDYQEYAQRRGFAFNPEVIHKACTIVPDLKSLCDFIAYILIDKDLLETSRKEVCALVNHFSDGNATARVVNFIWDNIKR
jgi:CDP-glycerol glycerophosphotransferase (TagB/SpsB family)